MPNLINLLSIVFLPEIFDSPHVCTFGMRRHLTNNEADRIQLTRSIHLRVLRAGLFPYRGPAPKMPYTGGMRLPIVSTLGRPGFEIHSSTVRSPPHTNQAHRGK